MPSVTVHPPGEIPNAQPAAPAAPPAPASAPQPSAPAPGKAATRYVTDANGRQIGWRRLNALEDFDLTEIAGSQNAGNEEWMLRASIAFGVREIDGETVSRPTSKQQLRALVARLDDAGMAAVLALVGEMMSGDAGSEGIDRAKN
jgi:hypothetical protein